MSAWLILQVASVIAPSLGLPAWTLRALLGILLLGFSVALFAGWRLDVRAAKANKLPVNFHLMVWPAITLFLLGGVILVLTVFAGARREEMAVPGANPLILSKSVAVLPFESLSESKSDSYFADGVQDEILSYLAKVSELKVISRTSVMTYRPGGNRDLRSIATALQVANVLEGTVRRDGNRVRITTELVDARTDRTVWSDSYDRDLTNIFAIQSEIAQTVAAKLSARLSPKEKQGMQEKPTENLDAYDLYLQGKSLFTNYLTGADFGNNGQHFLDSIALLEQATRMDPRFALAYCQIAKVDDWLYLLSLDHTPKRRVHGDDAVNEALRLNSNLPEAHLAAAFHLYICYRDYQQARVHIAIAERDLPNSAEAIALVAYLERRQGQWEDSTNALERAASLDPKNPEILNQLTGNYDLRGQYRDLERTLDRLMVLQPDNLDFKFRKASVSCEERADLSNLRTALESVPPSMKDNSVIISYRIYLSLYSRDWTAANEIIINDPNDEQFLGQIALPPIYTNISISKYQGEHPELFPKFLAARDQLLQKVEQDPENAELLSDLGLIDAYLGRKEEAIQEAKRSVEILPVSKDALNGPQLVVNLAIVYAWTNERDLAFQTLDFSTRAPGGPSYGNLKLDPDWDPLRTDPRFDKLLAQLAPHD